MERGGGETLLCLSLKRSLSPAVGSASPRTLSLETAGTNLCTTKAAGRLRRNFPMPQKLFLKLRQFLPVWFRRKRPRCHLHCFTLLLSGIRRSQRNTVLHKIQIIHTLACKANGESPLVSQATCLIPTSFQREAAVDGLMCILSEFCPHVYMSMYIKEK